MCSSPKRLCENLLVSTHICDAGPRLGDKILCSKSQEYPILGKQAKNSPLPLPPKIGTSDGGLSNFGSEAAKNTTPPPPTHTHKNFWT